MWRVCQRLSLLVFFFWSYSETAPGSDAQPLLFAFLLSLI